MKNRFKILVFSFLAMSINAAQQTDFYEILRKAVEDKNLELVKHAIEVGKLDIKDQKIYDRFYFAAYQDQFEIVKYFVDHFGDNLDANRLHSNIHRPLISEIEFIGLGNKSYKSMKYIIEHCKNLNIHVIDNHGYTPLHLAMLSKNIYIAKLLIEKDIDISILNHEGLSAFELLPNVTEKLLFKLHLTTDVIKPEYFNNIIDRGHRFYAGRFRGIMDHGYMYHHPKIAIWFLQHGVEIDKGPNLAHLLCNIIGSVSDLNTYRNYILETKKINSGNGSMLELFNRIQAVYIGIIQSGDIKKIKKLNNEYIRLLFSYQKMADLIVELIKSDNYAEETFIALMNKIAQEYDISKLVDSLGNSLLWYTLEKKNFRLSMLLITLSPESLDSLNVAVSSQTALSLIELKNKIDKREIEVSKEIEAYAFRKWLTNFVNNQMDQFFTEEMEKDLYKLFKYMSLGLIGFWIGSKLLR